MKYLFFCMWLCCYLLCSGQDARHELASKVYHLTKERNPPHLQLALDRARYAPGDVVWFRVATGFWKPADDIDTLRLFLVDRSTTRSVWSGRIVQQGGLAAGQIRLSHQLPAGAYSLYVVGRPVSESQGSCMVYQNIDIRSGAPPFLIPEMRGFLRGADERIVFTPRLTVWGKELPPEKIRYAIATRLSKMTSGWLVAGGTVRYLITSGRHLFDAGTTHTDGEGVARIETRAPDRALPLEMLIEVKAHGNSAARLIQVNPVFTVDAPELNAWENTKTGVVIVQASNLRADGRYLLAAYSRDLVHLQDTFALWTRPEDRTWHLPVSDLPPGELRLELYDSSARCVAATALMVQASSYQVAIKPTAQIYHRRSEVRVKIQCLTPDGHPCRGRFLVSCAQRDQMDQAYEDHFAIVKNGEEERLGGWKELDPDATVIGRRPVAREIQPGWIDTRPFSRRPHGWPMDQSPILYWNPAVQLDDRGQATVQFYTNDVRGRFVIRLLGKADGVTVEGRASIEVRK